MDAAIEQSHEDGPPHEKQLCVSCLFPNEPSANFCTKCGAPISSYAATGPFEHLFAEGHLYRQATQKPRNLFIVLSVWFIFGALAAGGIFLLLVGRDFRLLDIAIGSFMVAISVLIIWKTTRNYMMRMPKPSPDESDDPFPDS